VLIESYQHALQAKEEADLYSRSNTPKILVGCKSDLPNHIMNYEAIKVENHFV
jgi:GTPase SAR1 family protein